MRVFGAGAAPSTGFSVVPKPPAFKDNSAGPKLGRRQNMWSTTPVHCFPQAFQGSTATDGLRDLGIRNSWSTARQSQRMRSRIVIQTSCGYQRQWGRVRIRSIPLRRISALNIGPNPVHQTRTIL